MLKLLSQTRLGVSMNDIASTECKTDTSSSASMSLGYAGFRDTHQVFMTLCICRDFGFQPIQLPESV